MAERDSNHNINAKLLNQENKPQQEKKSKIGWVARAIQAIILLFVFALIYTLITDGECEEPIRLWLKGILIGFIVSFCLTGIVILMNLPKIVVIDILIFIWYIIGAIWFFQDDTCEASWQTGYIMSLVVIIFFFIISFICILYFFTLCWVTIVLEKVAKGINRENRYR